MEKNTERYWNGNKNKYIRYYFYSQRGLGLFNEFRYLFMLILGVYYALKFQHPSLLFIMFIVSVPVLMFFGWLQVHHLSKVIDWLNIEFSTHWGRYGYELQEKQNRILSSIDSKMEDKNVRI